MFGDVYAILPDDLLLCLSYQGAGIQGVPMCLSARYSSLVQIQKGLYQFSSSPFIQFRRIADVLPQVMSGAFNLDVVMHHASEISIRDVVACKLPPQGLHQTNKRPSRYQKLSLLNSNAMRNTSLFIMF
jgi:hypothetical protein